MLVTPKNLKSIISDLKGQSNIGFDTETYGLKWNDRLFSMIFYTSETKGSYFNFLEKDKDHLKYEIMPMLQEELFDDVDKLWFMHNAPYDMRRLSIEGCYLRGRTHCTQAIGRLLKNTHMSYTLDACLKRDLGMEKDDGVDTYIKKNKCWTVIDSAITKKKVKDKHYDQVPLDILLPYGIRDAEGTYKLGIYQLAELDKIQETHKLTHQLYNNEIELTKTICTMETNGIQIDREYCEKGLEYEMGRTRDLTNDLSEMTGTQYKAGRLWLREQFDRYGYKYDINPGTRNPIFDKHALAKMDNPIALKIKEIRHHENYARNFYNAFLNYADADNIVHANIKQGGTDTGRFSYSNPNMQNVPKEENHKGLNFIVRRAFRPRNGYTFVAIDYDQQEFRLMLDYAGETKLIKRIVNEGLDVHEATAQMMSSTRKEAKTLNFGLLYGMGVETLASALSCTMGEAHILRERYFAALPMVERLTYKIKEKAKIMKSVYTWAGRRLCFDQANLTYKAPNHLIQGGCGDIMRIAMNQSSKALEGYKSKLCLTIHDELLLEVHDSEYGIEDKVKTIMEGIYTGTNGMVLTCGMDHSKVSFAQADMIQGAPK